VNITRRRILQSRHDFGGDRVLRLAITLHDEGAGLVYRVEEGTIGNQWAWVGSEGEARASAAEALKTTGHSCSDRCTDWEAIPPPEDSEPMS